MDLLTTAPLNGFVGSLERSYFLRTPQVISSQTPASHCYPLTLTPPQFTGGHKQPWIVPHLGKLVAPWELFSQRLCPLLHSRMVPRYALPKSTLPHRKAYRTRWAADTRVRAPEFPTPPCHPLPAPSEVPPPSATNLLPAKGRRLGHGPLPWPLRAAAGCTFHSPDCRGCTRHAAGLCIAQCHPEPPVVTMAVKSVTPGGSSRVPVRRHRGCSKSQLSAR